MVIKLQPSQISALWDAIKEAAIRANFVPEEHQQEYANRVLEALLTERYQCWVLCYDDGAAQRQISAIGLTSIVDDNLFSVRYLSMHTVFGFRPMTPELKEEGFKAFSAYARANDCTEIRTSTNHPVIKGMALAAGMKKILTTYSAEL